MSKITKTLEKKKDDLGDISYSKTKKILKEWAAIRDKYYPECDRWSNETPKKCDNLYEQEERDEEHKKFKFYKGRALSRFWSLIPEAQYRLSLMSIFNLTDEIKFANHKAKKLRN